MLEDCLDGLSSVADVVVVEFFDVRGIDCFAYDLVDNDGVDALLFPELLAFEIVVCHDASSVGEVVLFARFAGTMGGRTRRVVVSVGTLVTVWYSALLRTSARWPCRPPQLVVFTAAVILVICCLSTFMVEFDGWPTILSSDMGVMMARTASWMVASLAVGDDMFFVVNGLVDCRLVRFLIGKKNSFVSHHC